MFAQHTFLALAAAAVASAQSVYGPPVAYCPPSCTTPGSNLTTTQNVTFSECTATTTRWGRHTNTVTTTTTGPPTACPYRLTVTPSPSACPSVSNVTLVSNVTVTSITTAPPSACPYRSTITVTPSHSACPTRKTTVTSITTAPPSACPYAITETITETATRNFTSTVTQNVTSTVTQNITVTSTPTPSPSAYTGPYIEVLTFPSANCSNEGATAIGYGPDIERYVLTVDPDTNSSPCTKLTVELGSLEFDVVGTSYPTACYLNLYYADQCVSDGISRVSVDVQDDQCWAFNNPRSMQVTCDAA